MDGDLSPQDKKDLDKFIKFFALKVRGQPKACIYVVSKGFFTWSKSFPDFFYYPFRPPHPCFQQLPPDSFPHHCLFLSVDCSGDRSSSPGGEDLHSLVFVTHWLRLGKTKAPFNFFLIHFISLPCWSSDVKHFVPLFLVLYSLIWPSKTSQRSLMRPRRRWPANFQASADPCVWRSP